MELREIQKRISIVLLSKSFLCLLMIVHLPAYEIEEESGSGRPVWIVEHGGHREPSGNDDNTVLKVGSNLTLSCFADALDLQREVLKVSLLQGDALLPLVENGLVHSPFSSIARYAATLNEDPVKGVSMTITVIDIQPEDSGTYICHKYLERDNAAVMNVTVLAPITDLYLTTIFPDGDEVRVDGDSEVFLQEYDYYGVGCVATVEGSVTPPDVRIVINEQDETESFQSIHQVDASVLQSGLTLWSSHLRLALVTATPNPDFNEKQIKCIAVQNGFPEVHTSARLTIQYAPLIQCKPERLEARQGTSATFDCNIRANPGSRIMWSSARGDLSNYPNVFFDETIISSDETELRLSIRDVKAINFQRYTLTAANIVASSQATFELLEDPTILPEKHLEVESILQEDVLPEVLEGVFPDADYLPSAEFTVSSEVNTALPQDVRSSTEVTSNVLVMESAIPETSSALPELRSTLPDPEATMPEATVTFRHVKKSKHNSTTSHIKEAKDDLEPAASEEAESSSSETNLASPELEQPLVPAGVHYSHSRSSSSSSSSKKDTSSNKDSGKTSKSTSSAAISAAAIQYLFLLSIVIRWL